MVIKIFSGAVKITVVNITLYPDTVTREGDGGRVHPVRGVRGGGRPHARRQLLRSHPQHHQVHTPSSSQSSKPRILG